MSSCLYISAILEDVGSRVEKLDDLVSELPNTRKRMKIQFVEMLHLHITAIECVNLVNNQVLVNIKLIQSFSFYKHSK